MRTTDPTTYKGWATTLAQIWGPHFPVDVKRIALEYSPRFADPILKVVEADIGGFEGTLQPLQKKGGWAILYNPSIASAGRINYTLAHEVGHYFAHRHAQPAGFQCGQGDVLGTATQSAFRQQEREADDFASYLLMPLDDFRRQVGKSPMTFGLLRHCAERYQVSLTAAALKWIEYTEACATLVVATNGFVSWCRRSAAAKAASIYFPSGMALPSGSIAALGEAAQVSEGAALPPGVWGRSPVREIAIFADRYEMTFSLLIFEHDATRGHGWAAEDVEDAHDRFQASVSERRTWD